MTLPLLVVLISVAAPDDPKPAPKAAEPAAKEPMLRGELLRRMKAEQDVRVELTRLLPGAKFFDQKEREKPEAKALFAKMRTIDEDNLKWFKEVVEEDGWPGKSRVGKDGAQAAFLLAQHAVGDPAFLTKCLGLLRDAYKKGEAEGQHLALLTDRHRVLVEKKNQLYGSQLTAKDGKLVPLPIDEEENVDARRKELGLPPLADYLKAVNERKREDKPADSKKG
jgi:hypothetical protein